MFCRMGCFGSFLLRLAVTVPLSARARVGAEYRKRCGEGSEGWDKSAWAWAMTKWPEKMVEAE